MQQLHTTVRTLDGTEYPVGVFAGALGPRLVINHSSHWAYDVRRLVLEPTAAGETFAFNGTQPRYVLDAESTAVVMQLARSASGLDEALLDRLASMWQDAVAIRSALGGGQRGEGITWDAFWTLVDDAQRLYDGAAAA